MIWGFASPVRPVVPAQVKCGNSRSGEKGGLSARCPRVMSRGPWRGGCRPVRSPPSSEWVGGTIDADRQSVCQMTHLTPADECDPRTTNAPLSCRERGVCLMRCVLLPEHPVCRLQQSRGQPPCLPRQQQNRRVTAGPVLELHLNDAVSNHAGQQPVVDSEQLACLGAPA